MEPVGLMEYLTWVKEVAPRINALDMEIQRDLGVLCDPEHVASNAQIMAAVIQMGEQIERVTLSFCDFPGNLIDIPSASMKVRYKASLGIKPLVYQILFFSFYVHADKYPQSLQEALNFTFGDTWRKQGLTTPGGQGRTFQGDLAMGLDSYLRWLLSRAFYVLLYYHMRIQNKEEVDASEPLQRIYRLIEYDACGGEICKTLRQWGVPVER